MRTIMLLAAYSCRASPLPAALPAMGPRLEALVQGVCDKGAVNEGTRPNGGDLRHFRQPNDSLDPTLCRAACCNVSDCAVWVLMRSGAPGGSPCAPGKPCCYLKSADANPAVSEPAAIASGGKHVATDCSRCPHGDCPQHCTRKAPYPKLLPIGRGSYAMNRSTLAMAYNVSGMYDPHLAARFGAISFDHDNARTLWLSSFRNNTRRQIALPSSEELLAEQCRLVKQVNPRTRCLVYRNAALGLQWLSSEAAAMYGADADRLFLHAPNAAGAIYNDPGICNFPNGTEHSPLDQFFFNFSEPATERFWNDTAIFGKHGFASPHVDGFFIDDDAFGREHPTLQTDCGMSAAAVADFADKQHAALVRSFEAVVAGGGMVWDAMRDADGYEARAWGASTQNPTATNCSAWMADKCGRDYSDHALLMTPRCSQTTGLCDPTNASAAAFMLLRGPHAFWGGGFWWGVNAVTQPSLVDNRVHDLDPGTPLGSCVASADGNVFTRSFTRLTVRLDCAAFEGRFDPVSAALGAGGFPSSVTAPLKSDDGESAMLIEHLPARSDSWKRTRCGSPSSPGIDLITKWGKEITPDSVKSSFGYPRPQMVRGGGAAVSLNGLWEFQPFTPKPGQRPPFGTSLNGTILVPFPVESCLSGARNQSSSTDDVPPTYQNVWYRTTVRTSAAALAATTTLLHFGAVDWQAVGFVNGIWVGSHEGGYDSFSFDITAALKAGTNEIFVAVYDPSNAGRQPFGKQRTTSMYAPSGDTYSPNTGIWQTVWIENVPRAKHISDVKIFADAKQLHLNVKTSVPDAGTINVAVTGHGGRVVAVGAGKANLPFSISIPAAEIHLWSPESPFLYNCSLTYGTDAVDSYFGMREVALCKDAGGVNRPCLNGEYRFLSGVLDQSYWPDGQYTAPGDAALLFDLQEMQKLGLNMVRLHQKTNPQRYYYHADRLGIVILQDMVQHYGDSWGGVSPDGVAAERPYFEDLRRMIDSVAGHASVIQYELFNEDDMVSDFNVSDVVAFAKLYDSTRLIDADSGGEGLAAQDAFRIGDANDFHAGVWPPMGPTAGATDTQYAIVAEYGGVSFVTPGHAYQSHSMGANGKVFNKDCDWAMIGPPLSSPLATAQAIVQVMQYFDVNRTYSAAGLVQWTDIEAECDGILNYDRVAKFSAAETALIRDMSVKVVGKPVACTMPTRPPFEFPRWMV